jgi:FkbM family methyltransferase
LLEFLARRSGRFLAAMPMLQTLLRAGHLRWLDYRRQRFRRQLLSFCARVADQEAAPFMVKVGANDGVTGDPLGDLLLRDPRWHGLLIEPVPHCFAKLSQNYGDRERFKLMRLAVGEGPSEATFYFVDEAAQRENPELPAWSDRLGSFSRQHILNHLDGMLAPYIRELKVRVERLTDILDQQEIRSVTLLHIDTEGADLRVLESLDLNRLRPRAILIEHKHLTPEEKPRLRRLLRRHGYRIADGGVDYLARRDSS